MAGNASDGLRQLFSDVVRLEIELWDAVDRRLRETPGISMGDFDVMQVVERTESCRVYDIAEQLSITVGGTSKAVDRLERRGHVARRSNPGDRRSSIIELTPEGAQALAGAGAVVDDELQLRLGSVLPADSLAQLSSLIARLRSGLAKPPETDRA
ncbi:MarR family winged helix-turn-helix transcriptional regulator [Actinocrinis sp.]|uniref:MarR family winged helix-turn-helix transcriptional regulator n=1 Tax=Actinocrinis sp. TaxID=1920516 RepID=UPI002D59C95F|nr:MarR family transcriptional regulator [Actinocrinis sp.]HZP53428.1 MarR family transcriptional regulator [Actinocrinis sp.]